MIRPRAGSYAVSVYDPALKRKRWVGTFKTMREAREAERDAGRRRSVGGWMTCGEYVRRAAVREPLGQGLRPAVASKGDLARMLSALGREEDVEKLRQLRRLIELEHELGLGIDL